MPKLPVSTLFDLQINLTGAAAAIESFGRPCIIDTGNIQSAGALVPVVSLCSSLQDVADLGYDEWDKAYVLAKWLLSQANRPKTFLVASVFALSNAELTAVEAANSSWYAMLLTSRAAADITTVATWVETVAASRHLFFAESQDAAIFTALPSELSALETADRTRTACAARLVDQQTLTLTMSAALVALNSVTMDVNGTALAATVYAADSDATLAAIAVKLDALPSIDTAVVTAGPGPGTDTAREIVIKAADPLVPVVISGYACTLGASQNTAAIVETDTGAGAADAALLGKLLPQGLGQATAAGKTLKGLTVDDLSTAQYASATGQGGNVYVSIAGVDQIQRGQTSGFVAPGAHAFIDTIAMRDRLEAEIQQAVIAVLTPQVGKLPYNNSGIRAVANAAIAVCQRFVSAGMLEPFSVVDDWTIPDISEVTPADKTARHLAGITGNVVGTGAIQSVGMTINIQV